MPQQIPPIPEGWVGSTPEWYVYWALEKLGYQAGKDFVYQYPIMGGRLEYGGAILDFVLPALGIAINVQSVHYHYTKVGLRAHDALVKATATGMGYNLVYIDEADALRNPLYYTKAALSGVDYSMAALVQ